MKAIVLTRDGDPATAFEFQDVEIPKPADGQVQIKVECFGLNYADIMARKGLYNDRPVLPCILGYEAVGTISAIGTGVTGFELGQRVLGFTQFGAYAEYCVTDARGVVVIGDEMDAAAATAMATQYCTAWFSACMMVNLRAGDRVLIHAAAGGVGTALVQIAKWKGCTIFGTAGSDKKMEYLRDQGVHHPINYRKEDFVAAAQKHLGDERIDVAFDPIGGSNFKRTFSLVGSTGRIVTFGASEWSSSKGGFLDKLKLAFGFGFIHPIALLMKSRAVIGVNMLRVGEHKPEYLTECITQVTQLHKVGVLKPVVDSVFSASDIAAAHDRLEGRDSIGKIAVKW